MNSHRAEGGADLNRTIAIDLRSAGVPFQRNVFLRGSPALLDVNKALTLDPNSVAALFGRAEMFDDKKLYAKAAEDYSAIIKINSNDGQAYKGRANAYCKLKKPDLAAADEKRFVQLGGEIETPCSGQ